VGNRLLLAVWTGNWHANFVNGGGENLTPITSGINDQMPTDWLP
jgi:hypothetical protein